MGLRNGELSPFLQCAVTTLHGICAFDLPASRLLWREIYSGKDGLEIHIPILELGQQDSNHSQVIGNAPRLAEICHGISVHVHQACEITQGQTGETYPAAKLVVTHGAEDYHRSMIATTTMQIKDLSNNTK